MEEQLCPYTEKCLDYKYWKEYSGKNEIKVIVKDGNAYTCSVLNDLELNNLNKHACPAITELNFAEFIF